MPDVNSLRNRIASDHLRKQHLPLFVQLSALWDGLVARGLSGQADVRDDFFNLCTSIEGVCCERQ
jgi:hypothetical protein